jgi:hypothetical protein
MVITQDHMVTFEKTWWHLRRPWWYFIFAKSMVVSISPTYNRRIVTSACSLGDLIKNTQSRPLETRITTQWTTDGTDDNFIVVPLRLVDFLLTFCRFQLVDASISATGKERQRQVITTGKIMFAEIKYQQGKTCTWSGLKWFEVWVPQNIFLGWT